jgi:hypothetical protein
VIDTFECLSHLEAWLRDHLLAELPQQTIVVLAGRQTPDTFWRTDPVWRSGTRIIGLRNLSPQEADQILQARGIAPALRDGLLDESGRLMRLTYGHPLALILLADVIAASGSVPEQLDTDVIRRLTDCFTANLPSLMHRDALTLCAAARATTQDMLAAVIGEEAAPELFDWLGSLSFVEAGPSGLFPHDLVRDAVVADARWRGPDRWVHKGTQLLGYYLQRLRGGAGAVQRSVVTDMLFLHRHTPLMQRFVDFNALGSITFEPGDAEALADASWLVGQELDEASEALFRQWVGHRASHFWVLRDPARRLVGAGLCMDLAMMSPAEIAADQGLSSAWRWLGTQAAPLKPGDKALVARLVAVAGGWAESMAYMNAWQNCVSYLWLTLPQLAVFFSVTDENLDHWRPILNFIDFHLIEPRAFEVQGRPMALFVHDWRVRPVAQWIELLTARTSGVVDCDEPSSPDASPALMLSQALFEQAVREALKHWHDAQALAANPLLHARVVQGARQGEEPLPAALKRVIGGLLAPWRERPKDHKFLRALELTYFQPVGSQELAAERLGLPFGTYRYQLSSGVERLTRMLWQSETSI